MRIYNSVIFNTYVLLLMLVNVQFCLQCGDDFPTQPCKLPKSSENDNHAENNEREKKHRPKPIGYQLTLHWSTLII